MFKHAMKWGSVIFDYLVITILLTISLALIFPFPLIVTGTHKYFCFKIEERRLATIFTTIGENWSILWKFALLWSFMVALPVIYLVWFNMNGNNQIFISIIAYVVLIFALILISNGPILIIRMNLTLGQLLFNSFTLIYGCWYLLIASYILCIGYGVLVSYFPYVTPIGLHFLILFDNFASRKAFKKLKAKALKVDPKEIEEIENKDISNI